MNIVLAFIIVNFPLKEVKTINNEIIRMDTVYTKKPVYISFWALWCSQCIKELDKINMLKDSFDFYVIAINEDGERKKARAFSFVKGKKWQFPVALDQRQRLMRELGVLALPSSFLYDRHGDLIKKFTGFSEKNEGIFKKLVDSLNTHVDTGASLSD